MLVGSTVNRVAIIGAVRIPFARAMGAYAQYSNQELLTATLTGLVERYQLQGLALGEVAAGAVTKHSRDFNLTREAVLDSGLAPETPAYDLQQACGTSLETTITVGAKIALGQIEVGIAAGVDSASDVPVVYPRSYQQLLLKSARGRSVMEKLSPWFGLRPQHFKPQTPGVTEPRTGLSMGQSCEQMAKHWGIRREDQDALAASSHHKATAAYDAGFMNSLVIPFGGLQQDNNLRRDTSIEKLAKLKPVFDRGPNGTLTAGNSTPLTDGAAAVLLASEAWAGARNLPVLAYLSYGKTAAVDFVNKEGLLMAPAYAVPRMLQDAGLTLQDFDYYEIHEAFAAQVLCTLKAWESAEFCREKLGLATALGSIDRNKLNVVGSSLAVGHPFGATGARIVGVMAKLLAERGGQRGLISVCTAGGMGVTAIIEKA
ncbi:MAG: acetyl-CoA C-acetyltransferase [Steroidobacteraceae bacterium]